MCFMIYAVRSFLCGTVVCRSEAYIARVTRRLLQLSVRIVCTTIGAGRLPESLKTVTCAHRVRLSLRLCGWVACTLGGRPVAPSVLLGTHTLGGHSLVSLPLSLVRGERFDDVFQVSQDELVDHLILLEDGLKLAALDPIVLKSSIGGQPLLRVNYEAFLRVRK